MSFANVKNASKLRGKIVYTLGHSSRVPSLGYNTLVGSFHVEL